MKTILMLTLTLLSVSAFSQTNEDTTKTEKVVLSMENTKCFLSIDTKSLGARKIEPMVMIDSLGGQVLMAVINQDGRSYSAMARGAALDAKGETMFVSVETSTHDESKATGKSIRFSQSAAAGAIVFTNENPFGSVGLNSLSSISDEVRLIVICGLDGKVQEAMKKLMP